MKAKKTVTATEVTTTCPACTREQNEDRKLSKGELEQYRRALCEPHTAKREGKKAAPAKTAKAKSAKPAAPKARAAKVSAKRVAAPRAKKGEHKKDPSRVAAANKAWATIRAKQAAAGA